MPFRLVTWNINSLRLRLPLLEKLTDERKPDVICLQETKVPDPAFPLEAIIDLGYPHVAFQGMKSYNGVAILSRLPLAEHGVHHRCGREDCRHVFARLESGLEIHSVYIPSGGDVPDREANEKFGHKLDYIAELTRWWAERRDDGAARIMVGDFNVAPLETDVWSHRQLLDVVSHTPVEVELLDRLRDSHDWVDAVRHFVPADEPLFSWWSYRSADWTKNNRGRRLDHVWTTPALTDSLVAAEVFSAARSWTKPSDHVPVIVDFDDRVAGATRTR